MSVLTTILPITETVHGSPESASSALGNGYQLMKRGEVRGLEGFEEERFKREFGEIPLRRALYADLFVAVTANVVDRFDCETAIEQSNIKLDRFFLALNLNEKMWTFRSDMRFSWLEDRSYRHVNNRLHWPYSTFEDRPTFEDLTDAAKLTTTIEAAYSDESRYRAVITALDALQLGSYQFNASIRFLQEAIALEGLCAGSDSEITHKIATTCALLIGSSPEERKYIYNQTRKLYGIRSRIIHGSGQRATVDELKEIQQLIRKVLRRILSADILPNYESNQKHRDFLLQLGLEKTLTP
jgi:hypothetical protein